jgi:hypothetical protein
LRVDGKIEVAFRWIRRPKSPHKEQYTPFSEPDRREELRQRLNEIPGFDVGADKIDTRPTIGLDALSSPEAQDQLLEVFDWYVGHIAAAAAELAPAVRKERALRDEMWEELIDHGGPHGVTSRVVRDVGLYKGQAGIWADKSRTADLTPNGQGITVSVLHTGSAYDDDLDKDGLLYHYPDTGRPGRHDANEVEATKNAARFGLPIFVITYPEPNASTRNVKRGWVEDWDGQARTFLIRFSDKDNIEGTPGTQLQMPLSSERGDKGQEGEEPFQLTDSSPNGEVAERPTRPGQSRFKFHVVKRYGPCCVVCDVDIEAMLDACHLREKKHQGSDHSGNGLVLCANHHRAFDNGLFAIEPGTLTVHTQDGLDREDIGLTRTSIDHLERPPHPKALQWRWTKWTKEE